MSPLPGNSDTAVEERMSHMLAAYGQGAGCIYVSLEAVQALRAQYRSLIAAKLDSWDQHSLVLFEYARSLGRTSAAMASSRGATQISAGDYQQAAGLTAENASLAVACPFC